MELIAKQINKAVSENVIELFLYLEKENKDLAIKINQIIEKEDVLNNLESLILQLTRVYGICAYEQNVDLEIFRERIQQNLKTEVLFIDILKIYLRNIDISEINPDISTKAIEVQHDRIHQFLKSFYE